MEEHKHEEHREPHHAPVHKSRANTTLVVLAVALLLLIVVAGVQAVELTQIKKQLEDEKTTLSVGGASGAGSLKNSLESLPSMVGGC
ncbi:hypothetical protein HY501_00595 [Candidatus Woesearchaeota archaeon]|nr:hypothetical protein [Candidatus Woesearchaeota archaeon]